MTSERPPPCHDRRRVAPVAGAGSSSPESWSSGPLKASGHYSVMKGAFT
jgi:hypothetical protein